MSRLAFTRPAHAAIARTALALVAVALVAVANAAVAIPAVVAPRASTTTSRSEPRGRRSRCGGHSSARSAWPGPLPASPSC